MIISRFLPNPVGSDKAGEWIEILNNTDTVVDLTGWQIKDLAGKSYILQSGELKAGASVQVFYKTTKITLNNSGETIFLYNPTGGLADKLSFSGSAAEGHIIIKGFNSPAVNAPAVSRNLSADTLFVNHIIFINFGAALILSAVFFLIIKNLYHDFFEPVAVAN
ncbi:MAG: lamin tail domain-containing protein [Patescibacteria group bacterium]